MDEEGAPADSLETGLPWGCDEAERTPPWTPAMGGLHVSGASADALGVGSIRRSAREIVLVERDGAARGQPDGFGSARNGPVGAQAGAICQVPLMVRAPSAVSRARLIAPPSRFQSASTRAWPRRLARRPDRRSLCASLRSTLGRVAR